MCWLNYIFLTITFISFHHEFQVYGQLFDLLQTEKCRLKCEIPERESQMKCLRECLSIDLKPGKCPIVTTNEAIPRGGKRCANLCKTDPQCQRTEKCCRHECGSGCTVPIELNTTEGLPQIPTNVVVLVNETDITSDEVPIYLRWQLARNIHNRQSTFVVEERHCFDENRIENMKESSWTAVKRTRHRFATLEHLFRPGLYYQFRVYSVNKNGTIGPSQPTKPYQISPNFTQLIPEAPTDFKVGSQSWGNGTLRYMLVWQKPQIQVPIYRYKISWSQLTETALVENSTYLSGNLDHFWLNDITPMTEYFLELRAIVKIGVKTIAGNTSRIFIRTPKSSPVKKRKRIMPKDINLLYKDTIHGIEVTKLYWLQENLYAIIRWKRIVENIVTNYSITWAPSKACSNYEPWYVVSTIEPQCEIYDLVPGCDYNISIKAMFNKTLYIGKLFIPAIKCNKEPEKQIDTKELSLAGAEMPVHQEFKPLRIVDCPLPKIY